MTELRLAALWTTERFHPDILGIKLFDQLTVPDEGLAVPHRLTVHDDVFDMISERICITGSSASAAMENPPLSNLL